MPLVADRLADLAVQTLDYAGGAQNLAHLRREGEKRDRLLPAPAPTAHHRLVAFPVGAGLEPVRLRDQQVLGAAGHELVHRPQPELRPRSARPTAPYLHAAVAGGPDGQVHRLVAHQALVADLHPQHVEVHERVDGLQGAVLPRRDLLDHRVGDRDHRDQRRRHPDAVQILDVRLDFARAHPANVHGDYLVTVEAILSISAEVKVPKTRGALPLLLTLPTFCHQWPLVNMQ